jgi:methylmalonyl-CoA/ethylmalonyl-CoA epimerase
MADHPTLHLGELGQIAFTVSDVNRAVEFFRDKVGLKLLFQAPPGLAFFACGSVRLMVSRPEGGLVAANSTLYFKVAALEAACTELRARGVEIEDGPKLIARLPDHELWMAFFRDPDRNLLALMCEQR